MGSAMAFVVMSFTTLAVAVAVNIRPVADAEAQPVPPVQSDTVPGRYLPQVPHAAGSGGVAGRGGVAGARRSGRAEGPDQPGPGAQ